MKRFVYLFIVAFNLSCNGDVKQQSIQLDSNFKDMNRDIDTLDVGVLIDGKKQGLWKRKINEDLLHVSYYDQDTMKYEFDINDFILNEYLIQDKYQLRIPLKWSVVDCEENCVLALVKDDQDESMFKANLVFVEESKADSLCKERIAKQIQGLTASLDNFKFTTSAKIDLSGNEAYHMVFTGSSKGVSLIGMMTIIEGDKDVIVVNGMGPMSSQKDYFLYKCAFEEVLATFKFN